MRRRGAGWLLDSVTIRRKDLLFASACVLLMLLKHMIASQLPIEARPSYRTDDLLMVMMTRNILRGEWLGTYSYGTLMKGCFYPLFLAGTYLSGISCLRALDLLNSLAALYFTLQMKPVLRRRRWMLILFGVLAFNPVTSAALTYQRIYRCSVTNMQTLFLFGSVIGIYLKKEDGFGRQMARAVLSGITLWSMWNTREDAAWVLPFVLVAGAVILIGRLRENRQRAAVICSVILFLTPFALLLGGNAAIGAVNGLYYGKPIRNEASSEFGKMLRTMYSIKNTEEHEYVSVTAEKLQRMYAVSPTLRQIEPEMTQQLAFVDDGTDRVSGDGEVEDGWFFWCIRKALENSKLAPTLPEAEEYYRQVNLELEEAIQTPEIGFETQWTMPSALMSPWREEYAGKILPMTADAFGYMISFEEVSAVPRAQRTEEAKMISLFEGITGDAAIYDGTHLSDYRQLYIRRADFVASVYRAVNPVAAAVSAVLFVGMAVIALIRRMKEEIPWILVTTGIMLSVTVLLSGIAYTDMTAFGAIRYDYISGGYALSLAFEWTVILLSAERLGEMIRNRRGNHGRERD